MRLWIVYGFAVLLALADAQRNSRIHAMESKETSPDNSLIDIDVERGSDQDEAGSGQGRVYSTDDEDLITSGSGSGGGTPDPEEVDLPPRADAGSDVILRLPQNRVTLCGNGSSDDRAIVSYQWIKAQNMLSADMMGVRRVCVEVSSLQVGNYTFTLVVTDTGGNKDTAYVNVYVKPGATEKPLTPCQQLRESSKHIYGSFVPRCNAEGDYDSLQCRGYEGTSNCWCSDLDGREIPGTAKSPPVTPDCKNGENLPPCVFMLVQQHRSRMLGGFKPQCTLEGLFQAVQCSGSLCYCVHAESGVKIPNTEVIRGRPVCDGSMVRTTPGKEDTKITFLPPERLTPAPEEEITTKVNINIEKKDDKEKTTKKPAVSNDSEEEGSQMPSSAAHIMTQPGILAAIIGGSVVLLLCAVLLVMFVVYRMRKKDEGSYALEEPKKMPHYSYQRAPDKEFYA